MACLVVQGLKALSHLQSNNPVETMLGAIPETSLMSPGIPDSILKFLWRSCGGYGDDGVVVEQEADLVQGEADIWIVGER